MDSQSEFIGSLMTLSGRRLILLLGIGTSFCGYYPLDAAAEEPDPPCESRLTRKARVIYDLVLEKRDHGTNLNELSKEVTRDLITENKISKEEATVSAEQAFDCLVNHSK